MIAILKYGQFFFCTIKHKMCFHVFIMNRRKKIKLWHHGRRFSLDTIHIWDRFCETVIVIKNLVFHNSCSFLSVYLSVFVNISHSIFIGQKRLFKMPTMLYCEKIGRGEILISFSLGILKVKIPAAFFHKFVVKPSQIRKSLGIQNKVFSMQ